MPILYCDIFAVSFFTCIRLCWHINVKLDVRWYKRITLQGYKGTNFISGVHFCILITARIRRMTGGYIFTLCVSPHLGGVPTFRMVGGGYLLSGPGWGGGYLLSGPGGEYLLSGPGWGGTYSQVQVGGGVPTLRSGWGGVPTFPGPGGGVPTQVRIGGYLGRYPPTRVGTPPTRVGTPPPG